MFLAEYGMFLLKSLTIVISATLFFLLFFSMKMKLKKNKQDGTLTVKSLSNHFYELKLQMIKSVMNKKQVKSLLKELKKKTKEKNKINDNPKTFVLYFNGNIKATAVESLKEEINSILIIANKRDNVVLILESPGGIVSGYGLAASELERIRKKDIKLTIIIDKVAASGGYMMACVADKIIAAPFSIIGSIGVISQLPNFNKLLKNKGIEYEQVTSGQYKRTLTMFGKNTNKDRKKLQSELDEIHTLFKKLIMKKRPEIDIGLVSTGEYWLGTRAKELNLVDELMTSNDYLMKLYESGHDIYKVEYKKEQSFINKLSIACNSFKSIFNQDTLSL